MDVWMDRKISGSICGKMKRGDPTQLALEKGEVFCMNLHIRVHALVQHGSFREHRMQ